MKTRVDFLKQELRAKKQEGKEFGRSVGYGRDISRTTQLISRAKKSGVGQSSRTFIGEE